MSLAWQTRLPFIARRLFSSILSHAPGMALGGVGVNIGLLCAMPPAWKNLLPFIVCRLFRSILSHAPGMALGGLGANVGLLCAIPPAWGNLFPFIVRRLFNSILSHSPGMAVGRGSVGFFLRHAPGMADSLDVYSPPTFGSVRFCFPSVRCFPRTQSCLRGDDRRASSVSYCVCRSTSAL